MTFDQAVTLAVLAVVVAMLIWDRIRSDVVSLAGAAVLLVSGAVLSSEIESAFGSPAIITLASLFVIVYAIGLSGLLDRLIAVATRICRRIGATGLWIFIGLCGALSAFLNNTPIVVLAAPLIKETAETLSLSARRFLMPLSYIAILGGTCTLIGTSTNLLVNDMARVAGEPQFGMFDVTPVGLAIAFAGAIYLFFASGKLVDHAPPGVAVGVEQALDSPSRLHDGQPGAGRVFVEKRPLRPWRALLSVGIFV